MRLGLTDDTYQLIDFGKGRKLESLAGHLVDRPSPAADSFRPVQQDQWNHAQSIFDAKAKSWRHLQPWPQPCVVSCGAFRMPLRPTPFGHIGLFPEQAANWQWLSQSSADLSGSSGLNLFAYTGASTMAMVAAGMHVVHVDAAKPNVQAAREAASVNGWQDHPIRYLVDDAAKFVARECRRGNRYHTIVLDPPAYGHGPSGKAWRLERDLAPLLESCLELLTADRFRLLITGHSPEIDQNDVWMMIQDHRLIRQGRHRSALRMNSGRSQLTDASGRKLDAGFFLRVEA